MTSGATAEEFILIPRRMYVQSRPATEQILRDPSISNKSAYVSLVSNRPTSKSPRSLTQHAAKSSETQQLTDSVNENVTNAVFESLQALSAAQSAKSRNIFNRIMQHSNVHIDTDGKITLHGTPTRIHASSFLYNLQQPMKKLTESERNDYNSILSELQLPDHLVPNKIAKALIHASYPAPAGDPAIQTPEKPSTSRRVFTTPAWEPHTKKRKIKDIQKSAEKAPLPAWPKDDDEDDGEQAATTYKFSLPFWR